MTVQDENQRPKSPTVRVNGGTSIYYLDDLAFEKAVRILTTPGEPSEAAKRGAALLRKLYADSDRQ